MSFVDIKKHNLSSGVKKPRFVFDCGLSVCDFYEPIYCPLIQMYILYLLKIPTICCFLELGVDEGRFKAYLITGFVPILAH